MVMYNLSALLMVLKLKIMNLFRDERGEVNIVATVVLIGVAVLLAVLFKDQIGKLLGKMFRTIGDTANDVVTKEVTGN